MIAQPRPASTVIVLRPQATAVGSSYEVFLVKRNDRSSFMAGASVFPGGRVDASDSLDAPDRFCRHSDTAVQALSQYSPAEAIAYYVAAIRELFEEAGVLLALDADNQPLSLAHPERALRFQAYRTAVHQGMLPLPLILENEGLSFNLAALTPYAHWVTPELESKRFDTRFFVAVLPDGQEPIHDDSETVYSQWLTPRAALEAYAARNIFFAPPTLRTLEELVELPTIDAVLDFARRRTIIPIQPRLVEREGVLTLLLPGDPDYPVDAGLGVVGPTRVVLENGRWWSRMAEQGGG